MDATFRVGGLASGLDTNSMIDKLVEVESQPLQRIATRQASIGVQISKIGSLVSKLGALSDVAKSLGTNGVAVVSSSGNYDDFTVSGSAVAEGRYNVKVVSLARAAKARSGQFDSPDTIVPTGTLNISYDGTSKPVVIGANTSLADAAKKINAAAPGVVASVVTDGTKYYLSVSRRDTGYKGADPNAGLSFGTADPLTVPDPIFGLTVKQQAANAELEVDNLTVKSRSNNVANVIPGVTLALKGEGHAATDVSFTRDVDATANNLQGFVDAWNDVAKLLKADLSAPPGTTNTEESLGGSVVLGVQNRLQRFLSTAVNTTGTVRTLGDLGVKLQQDGTVTIDKTTLASALSKDPDAANTIFTKASSGLSAQVQAFVKGQTNSIDGTLVTRRKALEDTVKQLDDTATKTKEHVATYKDQLVKQFAAMEQLISGFQSAGQYLTAATNTNSSNK